MTIAYRLEEPKEQRPLAEPPYHQWVLPSGQPWTAFYRHVGGFLLRFPGLADFRMSENGCEVNCSPVPGTPRDVCRHLYLNQVLPLMLSRQGKLVFHASAVVLGDGAIAFLAESGRGKSTLAAAFAAAGNRFLTDDGMVLEEATDGFRVLPSHPSIRLREDSRRALMGDRPDSENDMRYAGKTRLSAQARMPHCENPLPLKAAYFLGPGDATEVRLIRLSGSQALVEWIRHAFILDVEDKTYLIAHLGSVSRLFQAVPCYHLDYPRRFEDLEQLRKIIDANATEQANS